MKYWYSEGRTCSECGKPISNTSRSGLCRTHFNTKLSRDPAVHAKKRETLLKALAESPARRASMREAARRAAKTRWANPEYAENAKRMMREKVQPISMRPEYRHHRVAAALKSAEVRIAWCPPEYRDEYRKLIKNRKLPSVEAKAIIRAKIKADLAALSPFERQQRALERGANLVANDSGPMFGEALKVG